MVTGHPQPGGVLLPLVAQGEGDRAVGDDRVDAHIGVLRLAEGDDALLRRDLAQAAVDVRRTGVVRRHHDELVRLLGEGHEGVLERLERAVVVEVIGVDVRDQGDRGVVEQERAVRLVGLDDEQLAASRLRALSERGDDAAVHEAGVFAEAEQTGDDHAGRRGLAVRAGDGDETLAADQPRQRLRPVQHRDALLERQLVLRVVLPQRAGDHERVGVADVRRVVADRDGGAESAQRVDVRRVPHVRPGHGVTGLQEQPRDAAHPRTADTDEVQCAQVVGDGGVEVGFDRHRCCFRFRESG